MSHFGLHHLLLSDLPRLRAFRDALRRRIRPGDVVVDLGAGTGILGLLALQAGAGRVYAVEKHPILRLARRLARENGVEDRLRFVDADIRRARLPERADWIVSDMVGQLGVDPELSRVLVRARRFLKPGGRFLPSSSRLWAGLVEAPGLHARHVRPGRGLGVGLDAFHRLAANRVGRMPAAPRRWAAGPREAFTFDFARDRAVFPRRARLRFRAARACRVHGIAVRSESLLAPGLRLESRTGSWRSPVFLPVERPLELRRGWPVDVELVLHDATTVEWSLGGERHCTLMDGWVGG
jgi:SAM-dependent methyltransferase